jgi:hypothetical protein
MQQKSKMAKLKITEVMQELSQGSENRSAIARLREIFGDIEVALNAGVKREAIWEAIQNEGYKMPLRTFESAINRIKKERRNGQQKHMATKTLSTQAASPVSGSNPLRALSRPPKDGDPNSIPAVKFEVDNS